MQEPTAETKVAVAALPLAERFKRENESPQKRAVLFLKLSPEQRAEFASLPVHTLLDLLKVPVRQRNKFYKAAASASGLLQVACEYAAFKAVQKEAAQREKEQKSEAAWAK